MSTYISTVKPVEYRTFYYDQYRNCMMDEDGWPVLDIYKYIKPNLFYLFRRGLTPNPYIVRINERVNGQLIRKIHEFILQDDEDE